MLLPSCARCTRAAHGWVSRTRAVRAGSLERSDPFSVVADGGKSAIVRFGKTVLPDFPDLRLSKFIRLLSKKRVCTNSESDTNPGSDVLFRHNLKIIAEGDPHAASLTGELLTLHASQWRNPCMTKVTARSEAVYTL